ncbi:MAG: aminotransferase class I/II-fold pyridoxal phosphate-dependent enzyme [Oscillospiraceae bacterium]|nr:aminotransferase class I/II-fold pyridoxal phosphate-dependent enzyme [Oscillospiraceae bacterium]
MEFSKRMDRFGESVFTVMKNRRTAVEQRGMEVIDLSIGAPNIPPAPHITKVLSEEALKPENYIYAIVDRPELLEAVAQWYQRRYGVSLDPATQITSVLGSQEGLSHIGLSILNEGDVVLLPEPCYPVFQDGAALGGGELHFMPLLEENDYIIDLDAIPEDIARRAKLMIVSYPNNPTCALAPDSFYDDLVAFAKKYDIIVIHDNAYSELVFDGNTCGSFLSHEGAMDVGVEFNSLSKTYGLAGARVGFCVGNPQVVDKLRTLKSNLDFGIFLPIQKAAIAAITGDQSCVEDVRNAYAARRDYLVEELGKLGWKIKKPAGTMFVWAKIPEAWQSSEEFCIALLERAGVSVTPGSAFGQLGEGYVRFALVRTEEEMRRAFDRIAESGVLEG